MSSRPCVTFNNNAGSTKSYDYVREHQEATATFDFVPLEREIKTQYRGRHDAESDDARRLGHSSSQTCERLESAGPNFGDGSRDANAKSKNEILTGLLYMNPDTQDLHDLLDTIDTPLNQLTEKDLCPGLEILKGINDSFR